MLTRRNLLKGAAAGVPIAMGSVARWPATALAQAGTKNFNGCPICWTTGLIELVWSRTREVSQ